MHEKVRGYVDLLRLHFFFAWPLLFCSGYLLATGIYGNFSWIDLLKTALIGFFGFEAGFILNDYIDREYDKFDIEKNRLTSYWRLFGTRPIPAGLVSPRAALGLFFILAFLATILIITLPYPHSLYVLIIMVVSYLLEAFYQLKKRKEVYPVAQLIGRIDFALFPVAGYLIAGFPDSTVLFYFLFFYPFAMAHLGANDLIDLPNDRSRGLNTITTLYGLKGTAIWIAVFTVIHAVFAIIFMTRLGWIGRTGLVAGLVLLSVANVAIMRQKSPEAALKVLPLFHVTMLVYAASIAVDSVV